MLTPHPLFNGVFAQIGSRVGRGGSEVGTHGATTAEGSEECVRCLMLGISELTFLVSPLPRINLGPPVERLEEGYPCFCNVFEWGNPPP